jgi:hypothetical protein
VAFTDLGFAVVEREDAGGDARGSSPSLSNAADRPCSAALHRRRTRSGKVKREPSPEPRRANSRGLSPVSLNGQRGIPKYEANERTPAVDDDQAIDVAGFDLVERTCRGDWVYGWARGDEERWLCFLERRLAISWMRDRLRRVRVLA